ncbi:glycosyltransferase family 39 protein [Pedobacter duraquae]|uniref:Dolichyl-phosphate-mannose-protein mannosyltransferase n=1 Tax=Pedobacter duraquae TaxID=425511 RepID=A0A4R6IF51_9SPHI|nr:glycosyltransferase family 39 protein [Pedobacter duraquae]TDO20692.1 dolichyl-phosphate-mannose-protein mannosyltransferase [Pedobacter duraquae]
MSRKTVILIGFIVLKFVLSYLLVDSAYDLQRDEYLHLDQANHLAWGFTSVPPVTSWISFVIKLLGSTVFWIRFFPALFGALTLLVVWKAIEELKGNLFALVLGATCILFSILLRLNLLYQPNSLDVLCWTAFYFFLIKFINSDRAKWLYIAAIVFAIGFLNKYNIGFLLIGLLPSVLLTEQRKLLTKKAIYLAVVLAFVLVLPNLIWQYENHFPVVHHMKELSATQLVHVNRLDFLQSQFIFFMGSWFIILFGLWALLMYPPFLKFKFFFYTIFITIAVFLLLKAKDYYAIGVYPIFLAFGAVYLSKILKSDWRLYLQSAALAIPILLFIPMYFYGFPNKSPEYIAEHGERYRDLGLLRWEDGKDHKLPQDYADMLGWKELAAKVDRVYASIPDKQKTIVLCDNYGQAGAINFYSKKGIKAVSFNADYVNWFNLDQHYINLIRVKDGEGDELQKTGPYFKYASKIAGVTNVLAREYGTVIFVFLDAKIDINKRISDEVKLAKTY